MEVKEREDEVRMIGRDAEVGTGQDVVVFTLSSSKGQRVT